MKWLLTLATHGWTVLLADPGLALRILTGTELAPNGVDGRLQIPRYADHALAPPVQLKHLLDRQTEDPSDGATTIAQYNAEGGPVDAILDTLRQTVSDKFGLLTSEDLYRIPVLFDLVPTIDGPKAGAITPDVVNGAVYGNTLISPDTFLYSSGAEDLNGNWQLDPGEDANGNLMLDIDASRDPFRFWIGQNLPPGLSAVFIDDWTIYHINEGEVHCSSNERRVIPSGPNWWTPSP